MKKTAKIKNWFIVAAGHEYMAPELLTSHLVGTLIEHHTLDCSQERDIYSSPIVELDLSNNRIETENTIYELIGPPETGYAAFLENQKKKLN